MVEEYPIGEENRQEIQKIEDFQTLISQSQEHINNIEKQIGQLIPLKGRVVDTMGDEDKEISQKINSITENAHNSKKKMDIIINKLKQEIENIDEQDVDLTEQRLKQNLFKSMIKKYTKTLQRFQDEENEIKKIKETKLIRGAEIALGQDLNEEQKEEVIENPGCVIQIYEDKFKQKAHVRLVNAVRDLEERHNDLKKLEKSILQLHELVEQFNLLVQYQGEMIDNIVENVQKSKEYINKGEVAIDKSKKNMKCTRKIKWIIVAVSVAVLLIILIPILVKLV